MQSNLRIDVMGWSNSDNYLDYGIVYSVKYNRDYGNSTNIQNSAEF